MKTKLLKKLRKRFIWKCIQKDFGGAMVDDYEWKAILKQAMLEETQGRIDAFDDGYQQGVESMVCTIQDKEWDGVDDGREYVKVKDWSAMRTRNI